MNLPLLLFAKKIITMDRPGSIEDGFVLVQGHRILQVGKRSDLRLSPSARLLDLGDTILLPGLINAHCHLDFTLLKGRVPYGGVFRDWLRRMGAKSSRMSQVDFRRSVAKGIQDSISAGTTTLCDISTSWESWGLLRRSGLRAFVFPELLDLIHPSSRDYWAQFQEKLLEKFRQAPPTATFRWGLSPHTPFTVSRELLQWAGRHLGMERDILTTIHVAESAEEGRFFSRGTGPIAEVQRAFHPDWTLPRETTPVRYLNDRGWLPKLNLAVHLNVVDEKDLRLLAKNRVAVVHCPGSHRFFGHPTFKYRQMKKHKITVCLGTDSLASNQSLSMFREMSLFGAAHPEVPAQEVLALATVKPAQALGFKDSLGQIRPGFLADMIGIPMAKGGKGKKRHQAPSEQVLEHQGPVSFSMVHGEPRLRLT